MDLLSDRHSIESKIQQNYPEYDEFSSILTMDMAKKYTVDNGHFAEKIKKVSFAF
jgi:hypothetical protein